MRTKKTLSPFLVSLVAALVLLLYVGLSAHWAHQRVTAGGGGGGNLVLYAFSNSDSESVGNLQFFVSEGVHKDPESTYIILVEHDLSPLNFALPPIPSNARYVLVSKTGCQGWGSIAWFLRTQATWVQSFDYYIFVDSSVRGPFLPAYIQDYYRWTDAFTDRLSKTVKLVGSAISCSDIPLGGDTRNVWRRNPHVLSAAMATDRVGLELMIGTPKVMECHHDPWDAVFYSELGASAAMLVAGYNLATLMVRYQGVDWRSKANWNCNSRLTPVIGQQYDGITLDPLEVMFVKLHSSLLSHESMAAQKAHKYHSWMLNVNQTRANLGKSAYLVDANRIKVPRMILLREVGAECFDLKYYVSMNHDLVDALTDNETIYKHFIYHGQFEARPFRYTCQPKYNKVIQRFQNF